ncbi:MAG: hypothetical protein R3B67_07265 [Phycisphaerales bacterium]
MGRHTGIGSGIDYVEEQIDLRRKQPGATISRLIRRAQWLSGPDRELFLAYYEQGLCATRIGVMLGMDPRSVRRSIRQMTARLNDPRAAYVAAHCNAWGRSRGAIARELFLRGRSMREVSQKLGISLHCVRKHRDAIEAMSIADRERRRESRAWQRAEREET